MSDTIKERVANGAKMLDLRSPGWHKKINREELDMGSCSRCIIGQITGNYFDKNTVGFDQYNDGYRYGFIEDGFGLRELWIKEIEARTR